MFCPKCGAQNPDGARFCGSCGAQLPSNASNGDIGGVNLTLAVRRDIR